eukprot:2658835-Prymnesium_polylepis.1
MLVHVDERPSASSAPATRWGQGATVQVRRLESLFAGPWAAERLAFAHLDVEGSELDVLEGSR